jgi:hypothetical protein
MQEFLATLFAVLLLDPMNAELRASLQAAQAPAAVVEQVSACSRNAAPVLLERVQDDPWWAATKALQLWAGWTTPETVLAEGAPQCRGAVALARPFLVGG